MLILAVLYQQVGASGKGSGQVCEIAVANKEGHEESSISGWSVMSHEKWNQEKQHWFTNGNPSTYKQGSFNMCLRHMGFRPTKGARFGGTGYDWDNSTGFVYDSEMKERYRSRRSRVETKSKGGEDQEAKQKSKILAKPQPPAVNLQTRTPDAPPST